MVSRKVVTATAAGVAIATSATCQASPLTALLRAAREAMRTKPEERKPHPVIEKTEQVVGGKRAAENTEATDLISVVAAGAFLLLSFWAMHKLHERKRKRSQDLQARGAR